MQQDNASIREFVYIVLSSSLLLRIFFPACLVRFHEEAHLVRL